MPYDVDGTEPSSANPDSLYVPFFAPDESDNDSNAFANDYLYDYPTGGSSTNWKTRQGNQAKYRNTIWQSNAKGRRIVDRNGNRSNYLYGPNSGCEIAPIQRPHRDNPSERRDNHPKIPQHPQSRPRPCLAVFIGAGLLWSRYAARATLSRILQTPVTRSPKQGISAVFGILALIAILACAIAGFGHR